jgi:hypothetical protein
MTKSQAQTYHALERARLEYAIAMAIWANAVHTADKRQVELSKATEVLEHARAAHRANK